MDGNMDPASDKWTIKNVKEDFMEIYNICVGVEDKILIIIFKASLATAMWPRDWESFSFTIYITFILNMP